MLARVAVTEQRRFSRVLICWNEADSETYAQMETIRQHSAEDEQEAKQ